MSPAAILTVLVRANTAQANAALAATDAQLKKTAASGVTAGQRVRSGMKVASIAALGVGLAAGKMAMDFDQEMTLVHTHAGASAQEIKNLRQPILDLARASEFGPSELAKALFRVESHGYRGAKAMEVLKKSVDLAQVGQSDLESTTYAVSAALNSGIKGSKNLGKNVGTMNAIVGEGSLRMEEMVLALNTGLLPAGKNFGLSLRQVGAGLDVMTRAGVPAQLAATRLRMTFSLLAAPTDKAVEQFDRIGLSSNQLAKDMRKGPDGLITAIQDLHDHLQRLNQVQQSQLLSRAFGGGRSSSAIQTLVEHTGELGKLYDEIQKKNDEFGSAVQAQNETTAHKVKVAWSSIETDLVEMGGVFAPIMAQLAGAVALVVHAFSMLPGPIKTAIFLMALFAYPVMKIVVLSRAFLVAIGVIEGGIAATGAAAEVASGQMALFGEESAAAGLGLLGPVGLAVGVAAVTAGLTYFLVKATDVPTAIDKVRSSSHSLSEAFAAHYKITKQLVPAHQALAATTQRINKLEEQGKSGSKEWIKAVQKQADAQMHLNDVQKAQASEMNKINENMPELIHNVQDLKKQQNQAAAAAQQTPWMHIQAADARELAEAIEKLRGAQLNQRRMTKGFAPVPEDAQHIISTFQDTFGKKLSIKIGLLKDPTMVADLEKMSNQLAFLGKPHRVQAILSDKTLTAGQKMAAIRKELLKLTGGKYTIGLDISQILAAERKAKGLHIWDQTMGSVAKLTQNHFHDIAAVAQFEMSKINKAVKSGKDPTDQMIASYKNMALGIDRAMRQGGVSVKKGTAQINTLIDAELKLLGQPTGIGGIEATPLGHAHGRAAPKAKGNQRGGVMVPGQGTGDKVPAYLEPGEVVWNKKAVAAMGGALAANKANKNFPRFAEGGIISHVAPGSQAAFDQTTATGVNVEIDQANKVIAAAKAKKKSQAAAIGGPGGTRMMDGKPVAIWIADILARARRQGTGFSVTSGYRSYAEQKRIYDSGVRPAAVPGTSHHEGTKYPSGAVDIAGASALNAWLLGKGKGFNAGHLVYAGAQDPVHFSHPYGGGYQLGGIIQMIQALQHGGSVRFAKYLKHGSHWLHPHNPLNADEGHTLLWQAGMSDHDAGLLTPVLPDESEGVWNVRNKQGSGATGVWQILGAVSSELSNLTNPVVNSINAAIKWNSNKGNESSQWPTLPGSGPAGSILRDMVGPGGKGASLGTPGTAGTTDKVSKKLANKLKKLRIDPAMQAKVNAMTALASQYDQYADYASQLDDDSGNTTIKGSFKGADEVAWLKAELKELFALRNFLIKTWLDLQDKIKTLRALLKKAKNKTAKKAINSQIRDDTGSLGDLQGSIDDIQGINGPMKVLDTLPAIDQIGGSIFDVRVRLRDASNGSTDGTGTGAKGLSAADLAAIGSLKSLGVIFNDTQFAGMFAGGGFIKPGMWGWTGEKGPEPVFGGKAGATVYPAGSGAAAGKTEVKLVLEDNRTIAYIDGERVAEVAHDVYDKRDKQKDIDSKKRGV